MTRLIKWSILLSLLVNVGGTYADSPSTISILKGQPAPFEGVLFNIDTANQVRADLIKLDQQTRLNALYELDNKQLAERVDFWRKTSENLSNRVIEADNRSFWQNSAWFGLGALTVILLAFATTKATGSN